jgi:hypothetical protein
MLAGDGRPAFVVQLTSTIMCPACGHSAVETMAMDACLVSYDCIGCGAHLRPEPGDCCVFCSFGSAPCPPIQAQPAGATDAATCCPG